MKDKILEAFEGEKLFFLDGFDNAIIGIEEYSLRVIYSVKKGLVSHKKMNPKMTREEIIETFFYKYIHVSKEENSPIWSLDAF